MKRFLLFLFSFIFLFSGISIAALYEGTWNSDDDYTLEQSWSAIVSGTFPEYLGTTVTINGRTPAPENFDVYSVTNLLQGDILYDSDFISEGSGWKRDFIKGYESGQYVGYFGNGVDFGDGLQYSATFDGHLGFTMHFDSFYNVVGLDNCFGELSGIVNEDPNFLITYRGTGGLTGLTAPSTAWGDVYWTEFEISQVPVPAAVWLFASGFIGLVAIRRKA
jgi:hypothetical protein